MRVQRTFLESFVFMPKPPILKSDMKKTCDRAEKAIHLSLSGFMDIENDPLL